MGSFSLWHWIIVLVIFSVPVGIGMAIWLFVRAARKPAAPSRPTVPASASPGPSAETRLQELACLRSKDLITDSEYEQQRSAVLRSV